MSLRQEWTPRYGEGVYLNSDFNINTCTAPFEAGRTVRRTHLLYGGYLGMLVLVQKVVKGVGNGVLGFKIHRQGRDDFKMTERHIRLGAFGS